MLSARRCIACKSFVQLGGLWLVMLTSRGTSDLLSMLGPPRVCNKHQSHSGPTAAQDEEVHEQLRRFTGIMHKLHGWVGGVVSTGDNGQQEGAKQGSADEEAQPADGASEGQLSKTGSAESAISAQAEKGYNPIVSGSGEPVAPALLHSVLLQHCMLKGCNIWAC